MKLIKNLICRFQGHRWIGSYSIRARQQKLFCAICGKGISE